MKAFIPRFIHQQYKAKNFEGDLTAYTMFVDISGFTPMTEALMGHGEEGAEILSGILNSVFRPTVNAVYQRGGFIAGFAGDAFTAIFPVDYQLSGKSYNADAKQVIFCGEKIQKIFKKQRLQKTKFGDFPLAAKVGIAYGTVKWGIVGSDKKTFFFRGDAIDACGDAEHHANKGEIILSESILSQLQEDAFQWKPLDEKFSKLTKIKFSRLKTPKLPRNIRLRKEIVSQFLPQSVINFSERGEFRNVVSIFISFDGISTREELNSFATIVLKHIFHFSGYFREISFGDKGGMIVAYLGAPVSFEDNISRALDFILAVQKDIPGIEKLKNLKWRIGITYGRVYSGFIGGRQRLQYSMLGDVVNLAARFMTKANWGEVWVSEDIYFLEKISYDFKKLGEFKFKGKSGKIPVYQLLEKKYILRTTFMGKFVGREAELENAKKCVQPLTEHKFAGILYVYGEAGVGKTRFIYELEKQETEFNWIYLPCDGILRKPFNPFQHFFSRYFNQLPENTTEMNQLLFGNIYDGLLHDFQAAKENAPVDDAMLEDLESELIRLKPIMAGFLGCEYQDSLYQQLDAKGRYENTIYAIKETLKALSLVEPLVIQLEDLHWIDDDSVNALKHVCRNVDDFPFLIVASSRYADDGSKPNLPTEAHATAIDLNTLSNEGVAEFAESLLGNKISQNFLENIMEKTMGNPFFAEQTIFYYKEAGIIDLTDGDVREWEIVKDQSVLPATINDLLIARIDRLSEEVKEVVQTASVLGNEFELNLLSAMLREDDFDEFVEEAEHSAIWSALTELKYIFSHALLQDAVYHMQLKMRLRALHEFAAETIEKLFGDDENRLAELAFHYEKAENIDKAIEYLEKAGDYAKDNYHNTQALDFYDRLIPILEHELEELSQQKA
jgi:class 3 adenylate cyclase